MYRDFRTVYWELIALDLFPSLGLRLWNNFTICNIILNLLLLFFNLSCKTSIVNLHLSDDFFFFFFSPLQFREQVVKETVEKLEQKLYEKLIQHNQSSEFSESCITTAPPSSETQTKNGSQPDWLISCCNCQARIVGVRYQCR